MHKLNVLRPDSLSSLRYSLFTGEALRLQHAKQWRLAAPNSTIENLYGPTEGTIDCFAQVLQADLELDAYHDMIAIGKPFPHIFAALIDEDNIFLPSHSKGQLVISGAQVVAGYWQSPELSRHKFLELKHPEWDVRKWYLTGDYCFQDKQGVFHYLYRIDNQCKIHGRRIELEEIEYHIRDITQCADVVAVVVPTENLDSKIVAMVNIPDLNHLKLRADLKYHLPAYMLPEHIIYLKDFIYNPTGKLDRQLLAEKAAQLLADRGQ